VSVSARGYSPPLCVALASLPIARTHNLRLSSGSSFSECPTSSVFGLFEPVCHRDVLMRLVAVEWYNSSALPAEVGYIFEAALHERFAIY